MKITPPCQPIFTPVLLIFDNVSDCDEWEQSFAELNLSEYDDD